MKSVRQLEIEEEIRSQHEGMLSMKDIGKIIGVRLHPSIQNFLDGVPYYIINGRRKWRVSDIAKRLCECEVRE